MNYRNPDWQQSLEMVQEWIRSDQEFARQLLPAVMDACSCNEITSEINTFNDHARAIIVSDLAAHLDAREFAYTLASLPSLDKAEWLDALRRHGIIP